MTEVYSRDSLGAFVPGPRVCLPPTGSGALDGLTFAAKDIFEVAGQVTGFGNPDWVTSHSPAERHAEAVARLLEQGARLLGKTITDELTYSLNGQNFHYGTPTNANAPGRIPGGSSSGSASAVAGGLVDFALGSDTGGSIRIPASYCGILGIRPTHGRVSSEGVLPLAASFDTVGWFAREGEVLRKVGRVLLGPDATRQTFSRLLLARDAFALAAPRASAALAPFLSRLEARVSRAEPVVVGEPGGGLDRWMMRFRRLQAREIWAQHGAWIESAKPRFGPEIAERFAWLRNVVTDVEEAEAAAEARLEFRRRLDRLLSPGSLLVLPSAPDIAPLLDADPASLRQHRDRVLALTVIAGFAGLPQVSLPVTMAEGAPLGLSLIAPRGADGALLTFAESFLKSLGA